MPPTQRTDTVDPEDQVRRVVLRALSRMMPESPVSSADDDAISAITDAVLDRDPAKVDQAIEKLRANRVSSLRIAERLVPQVARTLGHGWVCDELDFAAVTIGASRLQSMIRKLDDAWAIPAATSIGGSAAFLVGVPKGAQHTLGASVLAGQLRHRGFSVHLDFELTPERLEQLMRAEQFAGVMLSLSGEAHLDSGRKLVECCREVNRKTPVLVGGNILEQQEDMKTRTGADLATSDLEEALARCGFRDALRHVAANDPAPIARVAE